MADKEPLLRSIACWTLSRYSDSLKRLDPTGEKRLFEKYLQQILLRLSDEDSIVQEATCTGLINLIDSVPDQILPYAFDILKMLVCALEIYKGPTLTGVYDAIGKLIEFMYQKKMKKDEGLDLLLPAIFKQWDNTKDTDRLICPLLECFESLIKVLGPDFIKWADIVLDRVLRIMANLLPLIESDIDNIQQKTPLVDIEFIIRSIDIIGELCNAIGPKIEPSLVKKGAVPANIFVAACQSRNMQVRQYGCALIGDLIKAAKEYMRGPLGQIVTLLVSYISCDSTEIELYLTVCNNSCWTLGEIVITYPEFASECANLCIEKLANFFTVGKGKKAFAQNVAIVIGKLGLHAPEIVSRQIGKIIKGVCLSLRDLPAIDAKLYALKYFLI